MSPSYHIPWPGADLIRIKPQFIFRIDEIRERSDAPASIDNEGNWIPIAVTGWNERKGAGHGISHQWYWCDGSKIRLMRNYTPPDGARPYSTFSMFYSGGHGFWVLRGDATSPPEGDAWHRLLFEHNQQDYSSAVTNAGTHATLQVQRPDAKWPRMLLPDIYHGTAYSNPGYGGLTGDLPIFLSLLAFSMSPGKLATDLPAMMKDGDWKAHHNQSGRES
jgi:hypothetical protein